MKDQFMKVRSAVIVVLLVLSACEDSELVSDTPVAAPPPARL